MLAPVRIGKKLRCMAFPCNMSEYLKATDDTMRRYHACHCPFAKASLLSDAPVSPTLCNCSLGHVMNFIEASLGRSLRGRVIRSVLSGDLTCEYEIAIPDDIIAEYLTPWKQILLSRITTNIIAPLPCPELWNCMRMRWIGLHQRRGRLVLPWHFMSSWMKTGLRCSSRS